MSDNWSSTWDTQVNKQPPSPDEEEQQIILEAKERFKTCIGWEAAARTNFDFDYKFANGDCHNNYQWDQTILDMRSNSDDGVKPCLTINKVNQHNLMVINDSKQNKPGIRIRPIGDDASYDAAQVYQEIIYHIEYISNAENIYDSAMGFQVQAGIGYWRVNTDYISDNSFDQEIYIRRIKDPRAVYLDPNINEVDGSDAWFGFIFDDIPRDLFKTKHPDFAAIATRSALGDDDGWITEKNVRVCEYYRKTQDTDKLVHWITGNGEQVLKLHSKLDEMELLNYKEVKRTAETRQQYQFKERKVLIDTVEWFKIAGDRVISGMDKESRKWPGKYVPIVRIPGVETVIDGILDRKGHTRALIDPQRMYNWNASADVEYGALQTKVPWLAPAAAIEGLTTVWDTANTVNHSFLPYNHIDEDGNPIPAPTRPAPPVASPAYVQRMQLSINEMMMASGQFQSQFGENENAKSGVAINARQRQGDRATYHFLDNQSIGIRFTGKIIIDLVPKIYDTKRVMRITSQDGIVMNVTIDPNAQQDYQEQPTEETDKEEKIKNIIFNPNVGTYDIQSDTGPSYATRRMEAFNAMTQVAAQSKEFMERAGDIYFEMGDFPKADALSKRWKKFLPPNITGEAPDPQIEQAMHAAADHIEKLEGLVKQQSQEIADKDRTLSIQEGKLELDRDKVAVSEIREDFKALTERLGALGNAGPGISLEQIQPLIKQAIRESLQQPDLAENDNDISIGNGGTHINPKDGGDEPPAPGARKAKDGKWYLEQNGQHYLVE